MIYRWKTKETHAKFDIHTFNAKQNWKLEKHINTWVWSWLFKPKILPKNLDFKKHKLQHDWFLKNCGFFSLKTAFKESKRLCYLVITIHIKEGINHKDMLFIIFCFQTNVFCISIILYTHKHCRPLISKDQYVFHIEE